MYSLILPLSKQLFGSLLKKGKQLLGKKQEGILSAAFMMMVLIGLTKVVGFFKIHIFARFFGASTELDVFWAAFTLPDMIFNIVAVGSINAALIPLFAEKLEGKTSSTTRSGKKMAAFFSKVLNFLVLLFVILGTLVFIFAPQLSEFIANGGFGFVESSFSATDIELMTKLTRIMIFSPIILGVSSVYAAGIQVNKRFIIPSLAPLFYNIGIVAGVVLFVKILGMNVEGLAWSVWIGSILHLLIQIPLARKLKLKFNPLVGFYSDTVSKAVKLSLPRVFGLMGEQIIILVNTLIAVGLGAGALSSYKYGASLHLFPIQLIGSTIATAALPTLSLEHTKFKKTGESDFRKIFNRAVQQILFFILPAVVFLVVLRLPIVRLLLGAGEFDWTATVVTSWVLALFAFAIVGEALQGIIVRAYYAMQDTVTPVITSVISLIVNVIGAIYFTNFFSHFYDWRPVFNNVINHGRDAAVEYGQEFTRWFTTRNSSNAAVGGLALAAGVAVLLNCVLLLIILNRRMKVFTWEGFIKPFLRKFIASVFMFITMYATYRWWNFSLDTSTGLSILGLFTVVGGVGFLTYLTAAFIIDIKEVSIIVELAKRFIKKAKSIKI